MKLSDIASGVAEALKELLDRLSGEGAPQPIPVRVDDRRRPRR